MAWVRIIVKDDQISSRIYVLNVRINESSNDWICVGKGRKFMWAMKLNWYNIAGNYLNIAPADWANKTTSDYFHQHPD